MEKVLELSKTLDRDTLHFSRFNLEAAIKAEVKQELFYTFLDQYLSLGSIYAIRYSESLSDDKGIDQYLDNENLLVYTGYLYYCEPEVADASGIRFRKPFKLGKRDSCFNSGLLPSECSIRNSAMIKERIKRVLLKRVSKKLVQANKDYLVSLDYKLEDYDDRSNATYTLLITEMIYEK